MKERLDVLLVKQGFFESREKAKAVIMAGDVYVNGQREDKAGTSFDETKIQIEVRGVQLKYVSRGGLKLEKAMASFPIVLQDKVCMDIGSSTGGFTDCMLQNGATRVYSVDVGHGQLAWKLRNDPKVVCMESTNFRYMLREDLQDDISFASCDVSFISLTKILGPAREILAKDGEMVCLIKPQFEAGKDKVGKKGVVREPKVHEEVIAKVVDFASANGFSVLGLEHSPIKGPEGNIEYLIHLRKDDSVCLQMPECENEEEIAGDLVEKRKKYRLECEALEQERNEKLAGAKSREMMDQIKEIVEIAHGKLDQ